MHDLLTYRGNYAYWQSFLMVAAHAKGYSYAEVQTLFEARQQGASSLDGRAYRVAAENMIDIGKALLEYRLKAEPHDVSRHFLADKGVKPETPPSRQADPVRWRAYMRTFEQSHWFITKNVERYYETLNTTQWLSPSQIRELQDEKLRRLIRH